MMEERGPAKAFDQAAHRCFLRVELGTKIDRDVCPPASGDTTIREPLSPYESNCTTTDLQQCLSNRGILLPKKRYYTFSRPIRTCFQQVPRTCSAREIRESYFTTKNRYYFPSSRYGDITSYVGFLLSLGEAAAFMQVQPACIVLAPSCSAFFC